MGTILLKNQLENVQGTFQMVPKNELNIDTDSYQRNKTSLVRQIEEQGWNWPHCGTLTVGRREDDTLWVVDGGSRLRAAQSIEELNELPCMIFPSKGARDEAGTFSGMGINRVKLSGQDKHKGLVAAEDATALFVDRLLKDALSAQIKVTGCANALFDLSRTRDGKPNREAQSALRKIWPVLVELYNGKSISPSVVRAFHYIEINEVKGWSLTDPHVERRLYQIGIDGIELATRRGNLLKRSTPNWARQIVAEINKGLKSRRLKLPSE